MLLALTIRAAATPQMVNRFLIFIAYSSPGWFVYFLRRRTTYYLFVLSIGCAKFLAETVPLQKTPLLQRNENARCAIDARPPISAAQILRGHGRAASATTSWRFHRNAPRRRTRVANHD
jgi:hypothetical protein